MSTVYGYAENIQSVLVDNMDEFVSANDGTNFEIGVQGFSRALSYSFKYDLDTWGTIMFMGGTRPTDEAFADTSMMWEYICFIFTRWDSTIDMDQTISDIAESVMSSIAANRLTINPNGWAKVSSFMPSDSATDIEGISYLPVVFRVDVRKDY